MASLKMVSRPTTTKAASVYALIWYYICNAGVPNKYQFVVSVAGIFWDKTQLPLSGLFIKTQNNVYMTPPPQITFKYDCLLIHHSQAPTERLQI